MKPIKIKTWIVEIYLDTVSSCSPLLRQTMVSEERVYFSPPPPFKSLVSFTQRIYVLKII